TGSTAQDRVGLNPLVPLTNGNFVVSSPTWQAGGAGVGAVTWVNGTTGRTGAVSDTNSLVGGNTGDFDLVKVTRLANGNYVVATPGWDNLPAATTDVGAATWGSGTVGVVGKIDGAKSLVGTSNSDRVGS